jgi:two-component system phosphate regulon sensor histidine kinase PhoR
MSAISEAVLAVSQERRVLFYNPQFAYLFNLKNVGPDARVTEVSRAPALLEAYFEALDSGHTVRREIQLSVAEDRAARVFLLSVAPLKKKHNQEVYGVVGIFYDITELKQAERIRIEFVGNVSHELRTPVTTINGYLQTLMRDVQAGRWDGAEEFLRIIGQSVDRLRKLVEDLLNLSSIESGEDLKISEVDVRDITEGVLKQIPSGQHKINAHYGFLEMRADPGRLEQVVRNLVENAVRYVPGGGVIDIDWVDHPKHWELHVKDNGPGIEKKHQSRLFERFYRVEESRARGAGGTGIGLSLVKHIVQRHGGKVYVRSVLGEGSEFVCEFEKN